MTEVLPNPSNRSKRLPCSRQKGFLLNLEIKLSVKFWWPLFLAQTFTFLFLNLAKNHIFIPRGGGPPVQERFLKNVLVLCKDVRNINKKISHEDFALNSKLWPGGFLLHLPIFAGNSRSTSISQLRAGKTRSKRPRSHFLSTGHLLPYT